MYPFFKKKKIYLFLAALGFCHCAGAFSSCNEWGRPTLHCGDFSCCGAQALECAGSVVEAHRLSCSRHVGSSSTRRGIHVPCIGRQICNHWTTREGPAMLIGVWCHLIAFICSSLRSMMLSLFSCTCYLINFFPHF